MANFLDTLTLLITADTAGAVTAIRGFGAEAETQFAAVEGEAGAAGATAGTEFAAGLQTSALTGFAAVQAAFVGFAVGKIATDAAKSAVELNRANVSLAATLEATGGSAGTTTEAIGKLANKIESTDAIYAGNVKQAAALLLTLRDIQNQAGSGNNIFDRTLQGAASLANVFGKDLNTTVLQLGRALENPVAGMQALQRSGVTFSQELRSQVEHLAKSGDLLGAQKAILDEINLRYSAAGAAIAKADPFQQLSVSFQKFKVEIGQDLLPIFGLVFETVKGTLDLINAMPAPMRQVAEYAALFALALEGALKFRQLTQGIGAVFSAAKKSITPTEEAATEGGTVGPTAAATSAKTQQTESSATATAAEKDLAAAETEQATAAAASAAKNKTLAESIASVEPAGTAAEKGLTGVAAGIDKTTAAMEIAEQQLNALNAQIAALGPAGEAAFAEMQAQLSGAPALFNYDLFAELGPQIEAAKAKLAEVAAAGETAGEQLSLGFENATQSVTLFLAAEEAAAAKSAELAAAASSAPLGQGALFDAEITQAQLFGAELDSLAVKFPIVAAQENVLNEQSTLFVKQMIEAEAAAAEMATSLEAVGTAAAGAYTQLTLLDENGAAVALSAEAVAAQRAAIAIAEFDAALANVGGGAAALDEGLATNIAALNAEAAAAETAKAALVDLKATEIGGALSNVGGAGVEAAVPIDTAAIAAASKRTALSQAYADLAPAEEIAPVAGAGILGSKIFRGSGFLGGGAAGAAEESAAFTPASLAAGPVGIGLGGYALAGLAGIGAFAGTKSVLDNLVGSDKHRDFQTIISDTGHLKTEIHDLFHDNAIEKGFGFGSWIAPAKNDIADLNKGLEATFDTKGPAAANQQFAQISANLIAAGLNAADVGRAFSPFVDYVQKAIDKTGTLAQTVREVQNDASQKLSDILDPKSPLSKAVEQANITDKYTAVTTAQDKLKQDYLDVAGTGDKAVAASQAVADAHQGEVDATIAVGDANQRVSDSYQQYADSQQKVIDTTHQLAEAQKALNDFNSPRGALERAYKADALQRRVVTTPEGEDQKQYDILTNQDANAQKLQSLQDGVTRAYEAQKNAIEDVGKAQRAQIDAQNAYTRAVEAQSKAHDKVATAITNQKKVHDEAASAIVADNGNILQAIDALVVEYAKAKAAKQLSNNEDRIWSQLIDNEIGQLNGPLAKAIQNSWGAYNNDVILGNALTTNLVTNATQLATLWNSVVGLFVKPNAAAAATPQQTAPAPTPGYAAAYPGINVPEPTFPPPPGEHWVRNGYTWQAVPNADGNIFRYAEGGKTEDHRAQIAKAGDMRLWAEPETGGEAYIPLSTSKRTRSTGILSQVADIFGMELAPKKYADGGTNATYADGAVSNATYEMSPTVYSAGGVADEVVTPSSYADGGLDVAGRPVLRDGKIYTPEQDAIARGQQALAAQIQASSGGGPSGVSKILEFVRTLITSDRSEFTRDQQTILRATADRDSAREQISRDTTLISATQSDLTRTLRNIEHDEQVIAATQRLVAVSPVVPGNIDVSSRPEVNVGGGQIATVRSITIGIDGGYFALIPTIIGGAQVSNQQAIQHFKSTNQHLGIFTSESSADSYATLLHNEQALAAIPRFEKGGKVEGPDGQPMLAIVHGGEHVLTKEQQKAANVDGSVTNFTQYADGGVAGGVTKYGDGAITNKHESAWAYGSLVSNVDGSVTKFASYADGGVHYGDGAITNKHQSAWAYGSMASYADGDILNHSLMTTYADGGIDMPMVAYANGDMLQAYADGGTSLPEVPRAYANGGINNGGSSSSSSNVQHITQENHFHKDAPTQADLDYANRQLGWTLARSGRGG